MRVDRSLRGRVAVVGIGETTYYKHGQSPDAEFKLALKAILAACADAGYLSGQLEAICGTRRLASLALRRVAGNTATAVQDFITDCDTAADRLQSHQPTLSTRFTAAERAIVAAGIAELAQASVRSA